MMWKMVQLSTQKTGYANYNMNNISSNQKYTILLCIAQNFCAYKKLLDEITNI